MTLWNELKPERFKLGMVTLLVMMVMNISNPNQCKFLNTAGTPLIAIMNDHFKVYNRRLVKHTHVTSLHLAVPYLLIRLLHSGLFNCCKGINECYNW